MVLQLDLAVCHCSGLSRTDFARGTDEDYTMVTRGMIQERIQVGCACTAGACVASMQ